MKKNIATSECWPAESVMPFEVRVGEAATGQWAELSRVFYLETPTA